MSDPSVPNFLCRNLVYVSDKARYLSYTVMSVLTLDIKCEVTLPYEYMYTSNTPPSERIEIEK